MYKKTISEDAAKYAEVLTNPFDVTTAARIPDFNSYATNTYTDSKEYTFGVSAGGVGGTAILVTPGSAAYWNEDTTAGAGVTTDLSFAYGNAQSLNGYSTNLAAYKVARVVGFGVKVEFIGNDQNNEGLITAVFCPSGNWVLNAFDDQTVADGTNQPNNGFITYGGGTGGSQTLLENSPYNVSTGAKNGLTMTWVPMDPRDLSFASVNNFNPGGNILNAPLGTFSGTTGNKWPYRGGFVVHVTGCATNAKFRVSIQAHYEAISRSDAGLDAEMSVNDAVGMDYAQNIAQAKARVVADERARAYAERATGKRKINLQSRTVNANPMDISRSRNTVGLPSPMMASYGGRGKKMKFGDLFG